MRCLLLLAPIILMSCKSDEVPSNTEGVREPVTYLSFDTIKQKSFWEATIIPFINKDTEKLKSLVHFPLAGDWGYMMELLKPEGQWTQKDFLDNYEKLFTPEVIHKLKMKSYNDVEVFHSVDGLVELLVGITFDRIEDGVKLESGFILRFKQLEGIWKLYLIQGTG